MSNSYTTTETWSRTRARYVSGKVIADLRGLAQEYGAPSEQVLENYLQELTELLDGHYVQEVSYGFKRNGVYLVALKFVADMNGELTTDDRSGRIPRAVDITGATFSSFLSYSEAWWNLTEDQRAKIKQGLAIKRTTGTDPGVVLSAGPLTRPTARPVTDFADPHMGIEHEHNRDI